MAARETAATGRNSTDPSGMAVPVLMPCTASHEICVQNRWSPRTSTNRVPGQPPAAGPSVKNARSDRSWTLA